MKEKQENISYSSEQPYDQDIKLIRENNTAELYQSLNKIIGNGNLGYLTELNNIFLSSIATPAEKIMFAKINKGSDLSLLSRLQKNDKTALVNTAAQRAIQDKNLDALKALKELDKNILTGLSAQDKTALIQRAIEAKNLDALKILQKWDKNILTGLSAQNKTALIQTAIQDKNLDALKALKELDYGILKGLSAENKTALIQNVTQTVIKEGSVSV